MKRFATTSMSHAYLSSPPVGRELISPLSLIPIMGTKASP